MLPSPSRPIVPPSPRTPAVPPSPLTPMPPCPRTPMLAPPPVPTLRRVVAGLPRVRTSWVVNWAWLFFADNKIIAVRRPSRLRGRPGQRRRDQRRQATDQASPLELVHSPHGRRLCLHALLFLHPVLRSRKLDRRARFTAPSQLPLRSQGRVKTYISGIRRTIRPTESSNKPYTE